jgi:hypothetical protein
MKNLWYGLGLLAVCTVLFFGFQFIQNKGHTAVISTFEDCVKAGFPILESFPEQCKTKDGKSFTHDVGNQLEYHDEIIILSPRPGETVKRNLTISGQAKGQWFFEGQFSAELLNDKGESLGQTAVKATAEWMTEDFVPFEATMNISKSESHNGNLYLRNANPSGLPENEKEIRIPVNIEN